MLKIKSRLASRRIEDSLFIVDVEKETLHELNSTAAFIWELLEKRKKETEIVEAVCGNFEVSAQEARTDVAAFLKALETRELAKR